MQFCMKINIFKSVESWTCHSLGGSSTHVWLYRTIPGWSRAAILQTSFRALSRFLECFVWKLTTSDINPGNTASRLTAYSVLSYLLTTLKTRPNPPSPQTCLTVNSVKNLGKYHHIFNHLSKLSLIDIKREQAQEQHQFAQVWPKLLLIAITVQLQYTHVFWWKLSGHPMEFTRLSAFSPPHKHSFVDSSNVEMSDIPEICVLRMLFAKPIPYKNCRGGSMETSSGSIVKRCSPLLMYT